MSINTNFPVDLDTPCATPRPDQHNQSFAFPSSSSFSTSTIRAPQFNLSSSAPPTPHVASSTTQPPAQQESERFKMRKARILRYELEQVLEDNAAIKSLQDLHNSHILSMHAINTEFYDLDGLSWSEPRARFLLDLWRNQRLHHPEEAAYSSTASTPVSASFNAADESATLSQCWSPRELEPSSSSSRPTRRLPSWRKRPPPLSTSLPSSSSSPPLPPSSSSPRILYSDPSSPTIRRPTTSPRSSSSSRIAQNRNNSPSSRHHPPHAIVRMAPRVSPKTRLVAVYNMAAISRQEASTGRSSSKRKFLMSGNDKSPEGAAMEGGVVVTTDVRTGRWVRPEMIISVPVPPPSTRG